MLPQLKALEILQTYEGKNNQILYWRHKIFEEKATITRSQADYILQYHNKPPKVAKKPIKIEAYFGERLQEERNLPNVPETIWCEKLLAESDKAFHIMGRVVDGAKLEFMWIPKCFIIREKKCNVCVDYSKYDHRPPMAHQKVAIEKLLCNDKFILADDMGLGKTASAVLASIESNSEKILIICPASLKINWKREIEMYTNASVSIVEGKEWEDGHKYYIINYDIIKNFHNVPGKKKTKKVEDVVIELEYTDEEKELMKRIDETKFDLMMIDECFTYNTLIQTNKGMIPIGEIVDNTMDVQILSYNKEEEKLEYKNINRWIKKTTNKKLVGVRLKNGKTIECTDNHKFYVKNKGYVPAGKLEKNDQLYVVSERTDKETNYKKDNLLFKGLCNTQKKFRQASKKRTYKKNMPGMWQRKNLQKQIGNDEAGMLRQNVYDETETQVRQNSSRKNEEKFTRPHVSCKGWQLKDNETTKITIRKPWGWMDIRITNQNKRSERIIQITPTFIQSGYWKRTHENCGGGRWKNTQTTQVEVFGQEENGSIEFVGVESVTVLERRSGKQFGRLSEKNTRVYDLEIEDNHNYFANQTLVSNCHFISNPKAQRTQLINNIAEKTKKLWLLTGTPMTSRPINYFNLLKLIDCPIAHNWQVYVRRYCKGYQFKVRGKRIWNVNGASNLDELRERTKPYLLRRLKTDILDLPEKIITPVYLELKSKEYEDEMEEYLDWSELEGKEASLSIHINKLMKVRTLIAREKVPYTIEMVERLLEQEKKVIVFTNFTETLESIARHFGKQAVTLDGRMNKLKRQHSVDQFQENPNIKVFVSNLKAGGVGITLTEAEAVVMNDLSFVPVEHAQAEDRSYRYGQKKSVSVYYPLFENTMEMIMYDILCRKKVVINTVMGDEEFNEDFGLSFLEKLSEGQE
jgi:hypothetical protein